MQGDNDGSPVADYEGGREITDPAITLIAATSWTSNWKSAECVTVGWLVMPESEWCCGVGRRCGEALREAGRGYYMLVGVAVGSLMLWYVIKFASTTGKIIWSS